MTDRPILFSAPMIRAILAGQKTQTRRVVKPQPYNDPSVKVRMRSPGVALFGCLADAAVGNEWICQYGAPGDRLWVREAYIAFGRWETRFSAAKGRDEWHFVDLTLESGRQYGYVADGDWPWPFKNKRALAGATPCWWTRPAIFMPRAASRFALNITGVRVERLQAISRGDAMAEGYPFPNMADGDDPRKWFEGLWASINGAESWDANPFVWVVEFERTAAALGEAA